MRADIDRETESRDFRCEEHILEYGYKFHMSDAAATIGLEQLRYVGRLLEEHRSNAAFYDGRFKNLRSLETLHYRSDRLSSCWLYTVLVENRQTFMEEIKRAGIMPSQVHARNDLHTMVREFRWNLPGVDAFVQRRVAIPVGWWLVPEEREHVAVTVERLWG